MLQLAASSSTLINNDMKQLLSVIVILTLLAGGVYLFFLAPGAQTASVSDAASEHHSKYPPREVPQGSKEFRSDLYGFSLLYPSDLTAKLIDEGSGAATVTFENDKTIEGFQIFIVPFDGAQITDDRFKKDIPLGVRKNIQNITIDGATGASFFSEDATLGETAEVWFIRGGYLYEVNTFKDRAEWLSSIMSSWKFLE